MTEEAKICPTCNAKTVRYKHVFNKGLALGLAKLYEVGKPANPSDLGLTHNQYNNFQKLRYWDLVSKWIDLKGKHKGGLWMVTPMGNSFVSGSAIRSHVWTYRGERVEYDGEPVLITNYLPTDYKQRVEYWGDAEGFKG